MKDQTAFWGCLVSANVWLAAQGAEPFDILMGIAWLCFAVAIFFTSRKSAV